MLQGEVFLKAPTFVKINRAWPRRSCAYIDENEKIFVTPEEEEDGGKEMRASVVSVGI